MAQMKRQGGPGGRGRDIRMRGGKPENSGKVIKRILGYIGKEWYMLLLAVLCVIIFSVTSLAGSYFLKPITDTLSENAIAIANAKGDVTGLISNAVASLTGMIVVLGIIYGFGILANFFQMRIMIGVSQRALIRIRKDLFDHLQDMPVRYFDTNSTGDIMSRFVNDIDAIGELLNNTIIQLISGVISIVGTLGIMIFENFWLSLVTIILTPVMFIAAMGIGKRSAKYYKEQQEDLGELNGYIEETVTGQKVVKVFNHEEKAINDFEMHNENLRNKQVKAQFLGSIMMPVMGNIGQIAYGLTATIGGIMCVGGMMTIGGLTIFVNYSRQFSRPINELSMQMNTFFSALAGAERVFTVMDMETEEAVDNGETEAADIKGKVEIKDVSFGYNADKMVLKNISLDVEPGQKVAFVGSTGAGKTTVTNLLNRFYDIDEGMIKIDGRDLKDYKLESLRGNIAMVLQDTHLFSDTVRENIRYGRPDATDEEVEEAAKVASAHSFIMRLKNRYDTKLESDGANLSQGQRQLLNIARAAISKAPILVLDEATSSVDTRTEMHIDHGMARLMKDRTTFVIAHRLSTVRNADCILVLENGEIIERGKHEELLEKKGRYYQLYTGAIELT